MTDHTAATGTGGEMLLRDNGSTVEFWVRAGAQATWFGAPGKTWSWSANGTSGGGTYTYSTGRPWVQLGTITVSTSQTVGFSIGATGTTGLGGPTSMSAYCPRATIPSEPRNLSVTNIGPTTAQLNFIAPASDGGSGIDHYLIRYSVNNPPYTSPYTDLVTYTGGNPITGLIPGTQYYFTVYAHNGVGYSPQAPTVGFRTLGPARVKVGGVWKMAIPYVKSGGVWKMAQPYVKNGGIWKKTG